MGGDVMDDATYTVAELAVLLQLATQQLHDLQQDFLALQDAMVRAHAILAALPTGSELSAVDIWGDRLPL